MKWKMHNVEQEGKAGRCAHHRERRQEGRNASCSEGGGGDSDPGLGEQGPGQGRPELVEGGVEAMAASRATPRVYSLANLRLTCSSCSRRTRPRMARSWRSVAGEVTEGSGGTTSSSSSCGGCA